MQKNDKCYTFLLSHRSKSRIYIRRVEVSKRSIHFGSIGLFLIIGLSTLSFGIAGLARNTVLAQTITGSSVFSSISAQQPSAAPQPTQIPAESYAFNSGGPEESEEIEGENGETSEVDSMLARIKSNADQSVLPSIWPHAGKINNEFGFRRNPFGGRSYEFHPGMDIDGERGDLVVAPAGGKILFAGYKGGYGNLIEIDHGNGLTTRYGHLSKIEAQVGDQVTRGQLIGYVGSTGRSTGPHLHYELRLNDRSINPRHVLPPESPDLNVK